MKIKNLKSNVIGIITIIFTMIIIIVPIIFLIMTSMLAIIKGNYFMGTVIYAIGILCSFYIYPKINKLEGRVRKIIELYLFYLIFPFYFGLGLTASIIPKLSSLLLVFASLIIIVANYLFYLGYDFYNWKLNNENGNKEKNILIFNNEKKLAIALVTSTITVIYSIPSDLSSELLEGIKIFALAPLAINLIFYAIIDYLLQLE